MKKILTIIALTALVGCGDDDAPKGESPDNSNPNNVSNVDMPFEPRFDVDELRRLETFERPANLPCRADVRVQFEEVASTKIESFGFDELGRLSFVIDVLNDEPQTKEIAIYDGDSDLIIGRVTFSYDVNVPTEYIAFEYDDGGRLLRQSQYRMTIDPDTMEWIPQDRAMNVIDHGYPAQNEWRYNDTGILFSITWDEDAGTLTTLQGQTVSTAFVSSDVSLAELTRLSTHLSPIDWPIQMDRAEFDETGDGTAEYTIEYNYTNDRLVEIVDTANSQFTYVYDCTE